MQREDVKWDRPIRSSVIIRNDTLRPGKGYWSSLEDLGVNVKSREKFWATQLDLLGMNVSLI